VLLDQEQAVALPTLPFAAQLKVLAQSPPLPVALVVAVDSRLPAPRAKAFQTALLKMKSTSDTDTLGSLRLKRFVLPQLPAHADKP
jgi:ABC-type phosphate/phosphonate transport system substrate-binding protein